MKINKPYFDVKHGTDVKNMIDLMLTNNVPVSDNGSIASFICPTDVFINGKTVSSEAALNVAYIIPNCSSKELAYFHLLLNTYTANAINQSIENSNLNTDSSIFIRNGKICGISTTDYTSQCGIGIQTIFVGNTKAIEGLDFEKLILPEEEKDKKIDALHDNLTRSFYVLRSYGTTNAFQYIIKRS